MKRRLQFQPLIAVNNRQLLVFALLVNIINSLYHITVAYANVRVQAVL